jgi:nucleoid-associated protein YgaU
MRSLLKLLMILSLMLTVSCSSNSADKSKDKKESVEEDADFLVDSEDELLDEEGEDEMLAEEDGEDMDEEEDVEVAEEDGDEMDEDEEIEVADEAEEEDEEMEEEEPMIADNDDDGAYAADVEMSGSYGNYKVKRGDTLMLIAFKIYGDYTKWRTIANLNPGSSRLAVGSVIKFQKPKRRFSWDPEGLPHLIRNGETLGTISNQKYGTQKRWKSIWNNNRPLIRNPNLIFAGFTVYYIPDEDRDVASDD